MGGGGGGVLGQLAKAVTVMSLGTVNPQKKGVLSPGVFTRPGDYGKDVANYSTVGLVKDSQGRAFNHSAKPPKLDLGVVNVDQAATHAANAVQTADAEARRMRASKRQSSALSGYSGSTQVGLSPATLQPAPARKSVLG